MEILSSCIVQLPNIIGLSGVGAILGAYFLLQFSFISAKSVAYSFFNLLGSIMIMLSLIYHWNLPAFIMECAWISISLYGLVKAFRFASNSIVDR